MSILWGNSMPHLNSMEQLPLDLKQESAQKFIYCVVRVVQRNGSLMCWCLIYFHCGWLWHKDISAIKLSCRVTIVVLEFSEWRKLSETFYWLVGASWNLSVVRECCCGQHIGATHISGTTFQWSQLNLIIGYIPLLEVLWVIGRQCNTKNGCCPGHVHGLDDLFELNCRVFLLFKVQITLYSMKLSSGWSG